MKILTPLTLFVLFLFQVPGVYASDPCCELELPMDSKTTKSLISLSQGIQKSINSPTCFDQKALSKKGQPEKELSQIMKNLSDEEVLTRLILAETLASGCPSAHTAEAIAWVIKNRVDAKNSKRFGIDREVAFKAYQFRSSTGDCDVAQREAFMCPSSVGLDKWKIAQKAFLKTQRSNISNPIGKNSYQYFFYKHFDKSQNCKKWKGVIPSWAKEGEDVKVASDLKLDRSCIRVFP